MSFPELNAEMREMRGVTLKSGHPESHAAMNAVLRGELSPATAGTDPADLGSGGGVEEDRSNLAPPDDFTKLARSLGCRDVDALYRLAGADIDDLRGAAFSSRVRAVLAERPWLVEPGYTGRPQLDAGAGRGVPPAAPVSMSDVFRAALRGEPEIVVAPNGMKLARIEVS